VDRVNAATDNPRNVAAAVTPP
jgi:hypothetical protein